jgi:hypothetical protein
MYRLIHYHAIKGAGEYVVILSEGENEDDYCLNGYMEDADLEIDGDATGFPTETILVAKS